MHCYKADLRMPGISERIVVNLNANYATLEAMPKVFDGFINREQFPIVSIVVFSIRELV